MTNRTALALISGGLDSILAARIADSLPGISVIGYHFRHPFAGETGDDGLLTAERAAFRAGLSIIVDSDDRGFIGMVKNPAHGRGKGVNPCRDCRIFILKKAARMLELIGGDFLVTGEVVGQRPMSQMRNSMFLIEKEAGLSGKILRPLCAKNLPPTIAEEKGWIRREDLYDFSGRNRKPQMKLADEIGVDEYPSPAGGCALTDLNFARRYEELEELAPEFGPTELESLKYGRHFRLPGGIKLIIARDEPECIEMRRKLAAKFWFLDTPDIPGPLGALDREPTEDELLSAAGLLASYGKARRLDSVRMELISPGGASRYFDVTPADKSDFREYLIH